jgi:hypothetical protein
MGGHGTGSVTPLVGRIWETEAKFIAVIIRYFGTSITFIDYGLTAATFIRAATGFHQKTFISFSNCLTKHRKPPLGVVSVWARV